MGLRFLGQQPPSGPSVNAQSGTSYTVLATDAGKLVRLNNASPVAVSLPQATGSFGTFPSGAWSASFANVGAGLVTITPTTSTINGAATLTLATGQSALVVSDGANYQIASMPALAAANNLSELASATTARSNLGLIITTAANFLANLANRVLTTDQVWSAAAPVVITYAATTTLDFNTFINGKITLTGALTVTTSNVTKAGQSGVIDFIQDGTGGWALTYTAAKFSSTGTLPTIATAANARTRLFYYIDENGRVFMSGSSSALVNN